MESKGYSYVPFDVTGGTKAAFFEGGRLYSDLSYVVALLPANQHLMLNVEETLSCADGEAFLLIRDSLAQSAIDTFPLLFEAALPLVAEERGCRFAPRRCPLYTFSNRAEYDRPRAARIRWLRLSGLYAPRTFPEDLGVLCGARELRDRGVHRPHLRGGSRRREASIHRASRFGAKRPSFPRERGPLRKGV